MEHHKLVALNAMAYIRDAMNFAEDEINDPLVALKIASKASEQMTSLIIALMMAHKNADVLDIQGSAKDDAKSHQLPNQLP